MIALVVGGASCGKSAFAERLCVALGGDLVYLATMRPFGEEGARRVAKHRAQRSGKGFETVECYGTEGLASALDDGRFDGRTVLLEDLGNVVANAVFDDARQRANLTDATALCGDLASDLLRLASASGNLVVVGNDVGGDGVSYPVETRLYQETLGAIAAKVAAFCDVVVECVVGCPMVIKLEGNVRIMDDVRGLLGIRHEA